MVYNMQELEKYPEIMSKEDFRKACHISKRTAQFLLEYDLIPHIYTGKKTHCYKIRKSDVIAFMADRKVNPERYIAPEKWYKYSGVSEKPYKIRILPNMPKSEHMHSFYEIRLKDVPDVLSVKDVIALTGYNFRTIETWVRKGKLRAMKLWGKYQIPKIWLIDWLSSEAYNAICRKTKQHIDTLWEINGWRKGVEPEQSKSSTKEQSKRRKTK